MFEGLVMGCLLMSDSECVVFSDTRGPYQTREQCVARAHEMAESLQSVFHDTPHEYTYKCESELPTET